VSSPQEVPELHNPNNLLRQADYQSYLHRIGRTGRFGRCGVSITLVASKEEWGLLTDIEHHFNTSITPIDTRDWDEVEATLKHAIKHPRSKESFINKCQGG
jgi:ATP-dependent RNA helicase DDX19/DBP5